MDAVGSLRGAQAGSSASTGLVCISLAARSALGGESGIDGADSGFGVDAAFNGATAGPLSLVVEADGVPVQGATAVVEGVFGSEGSSCLIVCLADVCSG